MDCKIIKNDQKTETNREKSHQLQPSFTAIPEPSFIFKTILKKKIYIVVIVVAEYGNPRRRRQVDRPPVAPGAGHRGFHGLKTNKN